MPLPRGPEVLDWTTLQSGQRVNLWYDEETHYDGVTVAFAVDHNEARFNVNGYSQSFFKSSGHRVFLR